MSFNFYDRTNQKIDISIYLRDTIIGHYLDGALRDDYIDIIDYSKYLILQVVKELDSINIFLEFKGKWNTNYAK